jgi:hypothetical protein
MVERNNDEERLVRIEHIVEGLQRESAAFRIIAARLAAALVEAAPCLPVPPDALRCGDRRSFRRR